MRLNRLLVAGYGPYAEPCELDLSEVEDCAVTGMNGAGKSSLFDAALWALYGDAPGRTIAEAVNSKHGEALVELEFTCSAGEQHFIRRTHDGSRRSTASYKGPQGDTSSSKAVSAHVAEILGCNSNLLSMTAWSRQGESGLFAELGEAGRREKLGKVILGSLFEGWYETLGTVKDQYISEALTAEHSYEAAVQQADGIAEAKTALEEAENEVLRTDLRAAELQSAWNNAKQIQARDNAIKQAKQAAEEWEILRNNPPAKRGDPSQEEQKATELLKEYETRSPVIIELRSKTAVAAEEAKRAALQNMESMERLQNLDRSDAKCWTCGQPLPDGLADELRHELKEHAKHKTMAERKASQASKEAQKVEKEISELQRRAKTQQKVADNLRHEYQQEMSAWERKVAAVETRAKSAKEHAAELNHVGDLDVEIPSKSEVEEARREANIATRRAGERQAEYDQKQKAEKMLPKLKQKMEHARLLADAATEIHDATKPAGVPHIALAKRLDLVVAHANEVLANISGSRSMQLSFHTSDPSKTRPPMAIRASIGGASERRYETLSGGEKMRVDIALRTALCRVAGVKCNTLILDEGWGALDSEGTAHLAQLFRRMIQNQTGGVRSVYTISHSEAAIGEFGWRLHVYKNDTTAKAELERIAT